MIAHLLSSVNRLGRRAESAKLLLTLQLSPSEGCRCQPALQQKVQCNE